MISSFFILTAAVLGQNLIVNGGFEADNGAHCVGDWCILDTPIAIAPWSVVPRGATPNFELDHTVWSSAEGQWSMDLSSDAPVSIKQTIATKIGKHYQVDFMLNDNRFCGGIPLVKTGFVSASSADAGSLQFSHRMTNTNFGLDWKPVQYNFIATETSTEITIGSTTEGSCGPVIDNVVATEAKCCKK